MIIDKDYNIIAGHGRVQAAKAEGIKEIPCVLLDYLTEAQKKAYIIADNRMALDAGWDEEILKVELESLKGNAFDLSLTGFDKDELSDLFGNDTEAKEDKFDVDEALEVEPFVKPGDVWKLGRHHLICDDSTKSDKVKVLIDGKKLISASLIHLTIAHTKAALE